MDEDLQRHLREHPELQRSIWPDAKRVGLGLLVITVVFLVRSTLFHSDPTTTEKLERCGAPAIVGLLGADGGLLPSDGVIAAETIWSLKWTSDCSTDAEFDYTVLINGEKVGLTISRSAFGNDAIAHLPAGTFTSSDRLCFAVATTSGGQMGAVGAQTCYAIGTSN